KAAILGAIRVGSVSGAEIGGKALGTVGKYGGGVIGTSIGAVGGGVVGAGRGAALGGRLAQKNWHQEVMDGDQGLLRRPVSRDQVRGRRRLARGQRAGPQG